MKTAIVGNSHVIAIRNALEATRPELSNQYEVFHLNNGWKVETTNDDSRGRGAFIKTTSTANEEITIDLRQFDRLVISGCGWFAARNEFVEVNDPPTHPLGFMACSDWGYRADRMPRTVRLVSTATFHTAVEAWVRKHPPVRLAIELAGRIECPVVLQPCPAPNRTLSRDPGWFPNRWYGDHGPAAWLGYFKAQFAATRKIADETGSSLVFLDYPIDEPHRDGFMDARWCGADPFHASRSYGELVLDQIERVHGKQSGSERV